MTIAYNEEFEHAITESLDHSRKQNYRVVIAKDVTANLFEHNEQLFDTAYLFVAEDTTSYEDIEGFLARPDGMGYGMVTVYRVPEKYEAQFRERVAALFKSMREGDTQLHYQESGYVWVYMKKIGNMLWAFASDDARNYFDFASLNPQTDPVDLSEIYGDERDTICAQREHVVRISGDENSDNGFDHWIYYDAPVLYRELVAMDIIAVVQGED